MASGFALVFLLGSIIGLFTVGAAPAQSDNHEKSADSFPPGWTQFGSRCFIYYFLHKSWSDAEKFCISVGGNLASIHNSNENTFVHDVVSRASGSRSTWIGGYDAIDERKWMWSDGSDFEFRHWYDNQPDNSGGNQHCLEIHYRGDFWNDMLCTHIRPFICSQDL